MSAPKTEVIESAEVQEIRAKTSPLVLELQRLVYGMTPRMPEEFEPGKVRVTFPDPSFVGEEHTIRDDYLVPLEGQTREEMHHRLAQLFTQQALAHLSLANWFKTEEDRERRKVAAELGIRLGETITANRTTLLDEIIRLRKAAQE